MAYRDRYHLEPLRVTAHFRTNPVCDQWLPLDGILLYQANREALGPELAALPGGVDTQGVGTLPLAIIHPGRRNWCYACSWAQPQPWWVAEEIRHWNKRFDTQYSDMVDFGDRRGKVIIEQGRYKAYHMPMFTRAALQAEWYCVGDKAEIERLLSLVTHIGKKRSQGFGRVWRWDVELWTEDWSIWRDGHLTRGVSDEDAGKALDRIFYGIRPPYYRKENQTWLAV